MSTIVYPPQFQLPIFPGCFLKIEISDETTQYFVVIEVLQEHFRAIDLTEGWRHEVITGKRSHLWKISPPTEVRGTFIGLEYSFRDDPTGIRRTIIAEHTLVDDCLRVLVTTELGCAYLPITQITITGVAPPRRT